MGQGWLGVVEILAVLIVLLALALVLLAAPATLVGPARRHV